MNEKVHQFTKAALYLSVIVLLLGANAAVLFGVVIKGEPESYFKISGKVIEMGLIGTIVFNMLYFEIKRRSKDKEVL